ncbi:hypothetical protein GALL_40270 [mine drainage metagenome]|uniref:Cellobiose phosphorylase n=1 Tax=mine drainage metagenome TaxID=410659 RepID=A0A1J5T298_9ZZZZ
MTRSAIPDQAQSSSVPPEVSGGFVDRFGGRAYRIENCDQLPPFFMNVVSASDLWLFLASNGGLTAGRIDAEHALFPYKTVDRIYDSAGHTGPFSAFWVGTSNSRVLWEPFAPHTSRVHAVRRNLYKSVEGDRVWFEEIHPSLGLVFRYGWSSSERYGFIRRCELQNLLDRPTPVRLLDGIRNLLPAGIGTRLINTSSCLTDAYKTAEAVSGTTLAIYALAASIVDRAIPMEALRSSAVWSAGLEGATLLLSETQVGAFYAGRPIEPELRRRGIRSAYALTQDRTLAPGETLSWMMAVDTELDQSAVTALRQELEQGLLPARALEDADATTQRLRALVASADGYQAGDDETATAHHFANVLFNIMRGGIFAEGYSIPGPAFAEFVRVRSRRVADAHAAFLSALPASIPRSELLAAVGDLSDPDFLRLAHEFLPLTFSRRHGDPSRPWNRFSIRIRDEHGGRRLHYEGNWRDIFQNWESLCLAFPEYIESIVAKFVNASTVDGYNPYRLSHEGIDWEVPDHEDPWSSIGYWGDHQVVYLLKLVEWSLRHHPGRLGAWMGAELFSYADVPYRISDYTAMRRDPHATIAFDDARHRAIAARVRAEGTDARLLHGADGRVRRVTLAEKLLLLVLTRLSNFVPGGGIWMNTQRPEWNDANNALVGYGLSMVTLCYLRRLVALLETALVPALEGHPARVSARVVSLAREVRRTLEHHRPLLARPQIGDADRRAVLDGLAEAGSAYRAAAYAEGPGTPIDFPADEFAALLSIAREHLDHTIRANRRDDGLYQAYNLLEFHESPASLRVHALYPMLEGQVAALSCGLLNPDEVLALLGAMHASGLYRADQDSYLLYPDRDLPGFLARNVVPPDAVESNALLSRLVAAGDTRVVVRAPDGRIHFHADLANAACLSDRLARLAQDPTWAALVDSNRKQVLAVYEAVFHHRAFTGRSGSMFGYEGLGCIYWHMVSKLLLAVQENLLAAGPGHPRERELAEAYYQVRAGLGFNKTPSGYGAFPTDPYSHTPGHAGAQQPGMTGQVKEEILTRVGELGVDVRAGRLGFRPRFLLDREFTTKPTRFVIPAAEGVERVIELPTGALAFTYCGVPVVYRLSRGPAFALVRLAGEPARRFHGAELDADTSALVFGRSTRVETIEVELGETFHPLT